MKIYIGSDHAGFLLKEKVCDYLQNKKYEVINMGTNSTDSVDYPDYARLVADNVSSNKDALGILICYTGIGMSMAANKVHGIRAALVTSVENAHLTREHNNANILCMGAKDVSDDLAFKIVDEFLNTTFAAGRHLRRVEKVMAIEK